MVSVQNANKAGNKKIHGTSINHNNSYNRVKCKLNNGIIVSSKY